MFPPIADGEVETLDDKKAQAAAARSPRCAARRPTSRAACACSSNARTSRETRARLEAEVDEIRLRNAQRIRETGILKESIYSLADEIRAFTSRRSRSSSA